MPEVDGIQNEKEFWLVFISTFDDELKRMEDPGYVAINKNPSVFFLEEIKTDSSLVILNQIRITEKQYNEINS